MTPRIGITEWAVIIVAALMLRSVTLVIFLRRRRPGTGFPVEPHDARGDELPPAPPPGAA